MRVLFLVHAHPELQAGGTELFARDLFRTLRERAIECAFIAGSAAHQRPTSPGTPFQSVGDQADEILAWTGGFDPFFMSQIDLHGLGQPFAELLREINPDIVHIHHLLTLGVEIVSVIRRVLPNARIVMTLHDYYAICANDGQMVTLKGRLCHRAHPDECRRCFPDRSHTDFRLRQIQIGRAFDLIDHFVAPSRFLRDRYINWGLSPERISLVQNGLPTQLPAKHRATRRRDRFAFFGHINKFKGATVALEASAILSRDDVAHRLTLHGGDDHQTAETLARFARACEQAPNATYRGPYRRSEFSTLIADADWVVFPSEWWENAPLVINEALQHGRPVLCSDIGGAAELVCDGVNGLHFSVGNARALADLMQRCVQDGVLWQQLVGGIEPPTTIAVSADQHLALYQDLLTLTPQVAA